MLKRFSIYLSENPTLRYWIVRPEWVAVILLISYVYKPFVTKDQ